MARANSGHIHGMTCPACRNVGWLLLERHAARAATGPVSLELARCNVPAVEAKPFAASRGGGRPACLSGLRVLPGVQSRGRHRCARGTPRSAENGAGPGRRESGFQAADSQAVASCHVRARSRSESGALSVTPGLTARLGPSSVVAGHSPGARRHCQGGDPGLRSRVHRATAPRRTGSQPDASRTDQALSSGAVRRLPANKPSGRRGRGFKSPPPDQVRAGFRRGSRKPANQSTRPVLHD
jgi:hypothetical protein